MRKLKLTLSTIAVVALVLLLVFLLPAGVRIETSSKVSIVLDTYEVLASPDEATYYFDTYHSTEKWTTAPEYMADNILTNYASTTVNNQVERLTGNTCPGTDLGTITKVEIRAYAYGDGNDELYIRPEFIGGAGNNHITVPGTSGSWGAYQNITNDPNAPSPWTWSEVQGLECDIEYDKTGSGATIYVSKVEIRITYSGAAPMGGSVAFVRATEGTVDGYTLTLSIEVSAGTDRVLVLGVAYKDNSPQMPASVTFNGTENFSVELHAADGGDAQICFYYLTAPTETTADVVYTQPVENRMVGFVAYFTGVDQNNPFTAATSEAVGTNNAPTVDVSSAADEIVVDIMCQVSGGPDTIDSNSGTLICNGAQTGGGTDTRGGGQYQTGEATTTMLYGMSSSDNWNIVAGALQEPVADPVITSAPNTWTLNGIVGDGEIIPDTVYYANPLGDTTIPSTTVVDGECNFTVTNSSTMAIDLTCTMGAFTGGDANMTNSDDGSNGATTFGAYSWFSGQLYANKAVIKSTGSSVGYDGLPATTDIKWGVEVETRTNAWTGGNSSTATLTITATID